MYDIVSYERQCNQKVSVMCTKVGGLSLVLSGKSRWKCRWSKNQIVFLNSLLYFFATLYLKFPNSCASLSKVFCHISFFFMYVCVCGCKRNYVFDTFFGNNQTSFSNHSYLNLKFLVFDGDFFI